MKLSFCHHLLWLERWVIPQLRRCWSPIFDPSCASWLSISPYCHPSLARSLCLPRLPHSTPTPSWSKDFHLLWTEFLPPSCMEPCHNPIQILINSHAKVEGWNPPSKYSKIKLLWLKQVKLRLVRVDIPSILNWNNASFKLSNLQKGWLGQIKVLVGWITPASIVIRQRVVWWAKVGGCDKQRRLPRLAPLVIIHTFYFITSSTGLPVVEQNLAQCSSL